MGFVGVEWDVLNFKEMNDVKVVQYYGQNAPWLFYIVLKHDPRKSTIYDEIPDVSDLDIFETYYIYSDYCIYVASVENQMVIKFL